MTFPKIALSFIAGTLCTTILWASTPAESVLALLLVLLTASIGVNVLQAHLGRQHSSQVAKLLELRDQQSALLRRASEQLDAYELAAGQPRGGADATF